MTRSYEIDFAIKSTPDRLITVYIEARSAREAEKILESEYKVRWIFNIKEVSK